MTVRNINQSFWSSKQLPYLTVRSTFHSRQSYKQHSHSELSLGLITQGSTCLSMDGETLILNQASGVFIQPHKVHACNPVRNHPRSYLMLYLDNQWCCDILSALYGYSVDEFVCDIRLVSASKTLALSVLLNGLIENECPEQALKVESMLFELICGHCSPQRVEASDTLCATLKKRLLADITNPPSLKDLALELDRSQEGLIRHFKQHFGITPKAFVNNHRIEKAKLLLKSGINIVDVAIEVGFSDQSQLHRAFVNYAACTPRQYQHLTSIFDNNF